MKAYKAQREEQYQKRIADVRAPQLLGRSSDTSCLFCAQNKRIDEPCQIVYRSQSVGLRKASVAQPGRTACEELMEAHQRINVVEQLPHFLCAGLQQLRLYSQEAGGGCNGAGEGHREEHRSQKERGGRPFLHLRRYLWQRA